MNEYEVEIELADEIAIEVELEAEIEIEVAELPFEIKIGDMTENIDVFEPANGQTEFMISLFPKTNTLVEVFINGVLIDSVTIDGKLVSYTGTSFSLSSEDFVKIIYFT